MARYYRYKIPESFLTVLIGNDKKQIVDTIKFYQSQRRLRIPEEKQIQEIQSLEITCCLPMMSNKFFFKAQITENFSFEMNANAVEYVKGAALGYRLLKRGSLYKIEHGLPEFWLWFLPEDLMTAIRDYDWKKHQEIMDKWNRFFDNIDFGDKMVLARGGMKNESR